MPTIYVDPVTTDEARRRGLYAGSLYALSPNSGSAELCALARELSEQAFAPHDPQVAQESMRVEDYVATLATLKPGFIHHPKAKALISQLLSELGCDLEKTYFDVPRLRTMAHGEYLKAGLALQFHPHRDTWFSAPQQQINWWLPVYEIERENSMAFHPRYFDTPVRNSSADYDYDEWNRTGRKQASQIVNAETRKQPRPEEPLDVTSEIRVITPVGGVLLFSAAHLHATVPNTTDRTRFSIDFRTVNIDDLLEGIGAPNVDSSCTGTTMRDYLRASDLAPLPDDIVDRYDRPRAGVMASATVS
jgi:Phytanoyl-CoA dioxygenase (PhyH)